jgi:hypothetical protein
MHGLDLSREIAGHDVSTAREMGWTTIKNGELLRLAAEHFDVFVTVDRNLSFQQNVASLSIAVIVLGGKNQPACRPEASGCGSSDRHRQPDARDGQAGHSRLNVASVGRKWNASGSELAKARIPFKPAGVPGRVSASPSRASSG